MPAFVAEKSSRISWPLRMSPARSSSVGRDLERGFAMKIQGPLLAMCVVKGGRRDRKEATVSDSWRPAELPSYGL